MRLRDFKKDGIPPPFLHGAIFPPTTRLAVVPLNTFQPLAPTPPGH